MSEEPTPVEVVEPAAAAAGPVSHAIFRVARLHRMLAGALLRQTGLYPGQELVMMHLWDVGPQRQVDLIKILDSDAATMTRTIQRLERAGFVRRLPSATDRRATIIEPTPASQALRRQVEDVWERLEQLTLGDLDAQARVAALETLEFVERNLIAANDDCLKRTNTRRSPHHGAA
jgi:DNA-binding MarR family transcriptional regulator